MPDRPGAGERKIRVVLSFLVAAATIAADQLAKLAVSGKVGLCERLPVLGTFFRLTHIRNSGAVFGVMRGAGSYFTLFSVVAGAVLVVAIFLARRSSILVKVSLGMVLGGAMGNLIDRLKFGAVVDFLDVGFGGRFRWPCFNIADAAITVGVLLLIANALRTSSSGSSHEGDNLESKPGDQGEDRQVPERG